MKQIRHTEKNRKLKVSLTSSRFDGDDRRRRRAATCFKLTTTSDGYASFQISGSRLIRERTSPKRVKKVG